MLQRSSERSSRPWYDLSETRKHHLIVSPFPRTIGNQHWISSSAVSDKNSRLRSIVCGYRFIFHTCIYIACSASGIGCAGEIRISENEDYDKWAIDILVKFRDEEKLQLLTGQRQSGGVSPHLLLLWTYRLTSMFPQGTLFDDNLVSHELN